jgi:hypothetical protein
MSLMPELWRALKIVVDAATVLKPGTGMRPLRRFVEFQPPASIAWHIIRQNLCCHRHYANCSTCCLLSSFAIWLTFRPCVSTPRSCRKLPGGALCTIARATGDMLGAAPVTMPGRGRRFRHRTDRRPRITTSELAGRAEQHGLVHGADARGPVWTPWAESSRARGECLNGLLARIARHARIGLDGVELRGDLTGEARLVLGDDGAVRAGDGGRAAIGEILHLAPATSHAALRVAQAGAVRVGGDESSHDRALLGRRRGRQHYRGAGLVNPALRHEDAIVEAVIWHCALRRSRLHAIYEPAFAPRASSARATSVRIRSFCACVRAGEAPAKRCHKSCPACSGLPRWRALGST